MDGEDITKLDEQKTNEFEMKKVFCVCKKKGKDSDYISETRF